MQEGNSIDIASEYDAYPAGRDDSDGPYNGTKFRNQILRPRYVKAFDDGVELVVFIDGVKSFGSSFLEEAFGGLVREFPDRKKDIERRIRVVGERPGSIRYLDAIKRYIKEA